MRTGMKLPDTYWQLLEEDSRHAPSGDGPTPPEGPPNIELRTGMKLPPTHQLFLDEASPQGWSGDGPAPPVGPPNIEVRKGVTMHPMHHLFEEILLDDSLGGGSTAPEGPPNIKLGTEPGLLRKLADRLAAAFRTRPVER
jgi:hypothetical protein